LQITVATSPTNGELDVEGMFSAYNATVTVVTVSAQALTATAAIYISLTNVMENPDFVPAR